ncbi:hypothetical protein HYX13_00455, partial [Candidatus Woesearchaeota archaeon]|nr:hypothetical protein [Candidatus Woesearchaeota archaeon]
MVQTKIEFNLGGRTNKDVGNLVHILLKEARQSDPEASGRSQGTSTGVFSVSAQVLTPWLEKNRRRLQKWGIKGYTIEEIEEKEER